MNEVDWMQVILVAGVIFLIVRNARKDKSDGRGITGGRSDGDGKIPHRK